MNINDFFTNLDIIYNPSRIVNMDSFNTDFTLSICIHPENIEMIRGIICGDIKIEKSKKWIDLIQMERLVCFTMEDYHKFRNLLLELIEFYLNSIFI